MKLTHLATAQAVFPITLIALLLLAAPLTGCTTEATVTPTPTKTPTLQPSSTPTPVPSTPVQALDAAAPAATSTPQATPTSTPEPPTATPTATTAPPAPTPTPAEQPGATDEAPEPDPFVGRPYKERNRVHAPTPSATVAAAFAINPLTGLPVDARKLNRRPLGVKIPNFPDEARPQSGLSRADVVIEHEAEAYLTRFTAIFLGSDAAPELGPVRSLRLVDAELMSIFGASLVASGGHPAVKIRITEGKSWAAGYKRIICPEAPFLGDGGTMRRVPKDGRRYELTLYSDTYSLWQLSSQRGVNQRHEFHDMWVFDGSPPAGGGGATHLKIVYKVGYSEAEYRYDARSHTYRRFDVGRPLMDALTGQQIAPANVLVLYVNHINSDILADNHDPAHPWYAVSIQLWGEGPARLLRDGRVYTVRWLRENAQLDGDRLTIVDGEGKQVPFRPGPTWIQLVRMDANVQID